MATDVQWIEDFYQDVKAQQIHYTRHIPPIYFQQMTKHVQYKSLIAEKMLKIDKDYSADDNSWSSGAQSVYETLATAKYANQYGLKIDEFLYKCSDGNLIIDDALFDKQHFTDYHVVVLSSMADYINKEYSKVVNGSGVISKQDQAILTAYTSCIVFLNDHNECFYIMPLYGDAWLFGNDVLSVTKRQYDQLIVPEPLHFPVIKVSFSYLQTVIKALPLATLKSNSTSNIIMYQYKGTRNTSLTMDRQQYYILTIEKMRSTDIFNNALERAYSNIQMVKQQLYQHAKLKCDQDGEVFYQISEFDQFWQNYYRHLQTQNLNDMVLSSSTSWRHDQQPFSQLVKDDWSELDDNVQVESADLPINKHKILKPLVKPQGLNKVIEMFHTDNQQQYYVYQDKLLQLEYSTIYQQLYVRGIKIL